MAEAVVETAVAGTPRRHACQHRPGFPRFRNALALGLAAQREPGAIPPRHRGRLPEDLGAEHDRYVRSAVEGHRDLLRRDLDGRGHVDEVAEDPAGLRLGIASHAPGETTEEPAPGKRLNPQAPGRPAPIRRPNPQALGGPARVRQPDPQAPGSPAPGGAPNRQAPGCLAPSRRPERPRTGRAKGVASVVSARCYDGFAGAGGGSGGGAVTLVVPGTARSWKMTAMRCILPESRNTHSTPLFVAA